MLRNNLSTRLSISRNSCFKRHISATSRRLADITTPKVNQPKKKHHFRNFVIGSFVLSTSLVGVGVWYSLQNDRFHDIFIEYVPGSESIINYIEEQRFQRETKKDEETAAETSPRSKVRVPKAGAEVRAISARDEHQSSPITSAVAPKPGSKPATKPQETTPSDKKTEKTAKKEEPKQSNAPKKYGGLPLVRVSSDASPELKQSVNSLNNLITAVNNSNASEKLVQKVSKDVGDLENSISALRANFEKEINKALEGQASKFAGLSEKRVSELRSTVEAQEKRWSEEFQKERQNIVDSYNGRLKVEIDATKNAVISAANNRILAVAKEQEKQFTKAVADRVEIERDGRLGHLKELQKSVEQVGELVEKSQDIISSSDNYLKYHQTVGLLNNVFQTAVEPIPLKPYLEKISQLFPDDTLIQSVIQSMPEEAIEHGVLAPAQLTARFKLLEPEIRKASLLPPDAGVAGHIGSWLFSKLLWKKQGNAVGDDFESIISRTETALYENRLTDAVVELNGLKGWPKLLAKDWIKEGRKRSEVEFLIKVLDTEGQLRGFSSK